MKLRILTALFTVFWSPNILAAKILSPKDSNNSSSTTTSPQNGCDWLENIDDYAHVLAAELLESPDPNQFAIMVQASSLEEDGLFLTAAYRIEEKNSQCISASIIENIRYVPVKWESSLSISVDMLLCDECSYLFTVLDSNSGSLYATTVELDINDQIRSDLEYWQDMQAVWEVAGLENWIDSSGLIPIIPYWKLLERAGVIAGNPRSGIEPSTTLRTGIPSGGNSAAASGCGLSLAPHMEVKSLSLAILFALGLFIALRRRLNHG